MTAKSKWTWGVIGLCLLCLVIIMITVVPYACANHQYEKLVREKPTSKKEVEELLDLYSINEIPIGKSMWGSSFKLEEGESCWQYKILWREPIDVIYDSQGQVKYILSSFE